MDILTTISEYEPSLLQRMLLIWVFIICGLVIALQVAQSFQDPRPGWTRLSQDRWPYWCAFYGLFAFLTVHISRRSLLQELDGLLWGYEAVVVDYVWTAFLAAEVFLLTVAAAVTLRRALNPTTKAKMA